jgi:hypothetical protein
MILDYISFVTKYPVYSNPPYDPDTVEAQIDELLVLFPAIKDCLPDESKLLALKYGVEWLNGLDDDESSFYLVDSVKSRNDAIKYRTRGSSGDLSGSLWGNRLNRLFKTNGCFYYFGKTGASSCGCSGMGVYGGACGCSKE